MCCSAACAHTRHLFRTFVSDVRVLAPSSAVPWRISPSTELISELNGQLGRRQLARFIVTATRIGRHLHRPSRRVQHAGSTWSVALCCPGCPDAIPAVGAQPEVIALPLRSGSSTFL